MVAACFPIGTKDLGFISKASRTRDNQSPGKALPSYQMSSAPIPTPTWTQAHTEEVREETNVFTETPREPSCQSRRASGKPLISMLGEMRIS